MHQMDSVEHNRANCSCVLFIVIILRMRRRFVTRLRWTLVIPKTHWTTVNARLGDYSRNRQRTGTASCSVSPHHQTDEELQALKPYPVQQYPPGYAPAKAAPSPVHQPPAAAAVGQFHPADQDALRQLLPSGIGLLNPQHFRDADVSTTSNCLRPVHSFIRNCGLT